MVDALRGRIKEYGNKLREEVTNRRNIAASYHHLIQELNVRLQTTIREKENVDDALHDRNKELVADLHGRINWKTGRKLRPNCVAV
jgi:hypothetical protein